MYASSTTRRFSQTIVLALVWLTCSAAADAAGPSVGAILKRHGVHRAPSGCQSFRSKKALVARKRAWLAAIGDMAKHHPKTTYGWIIGANRPPKAASREAERQRDCLVEAIIADAASGRSKGLKLEFERDKPASASEARGQLKRFRRDRRAKRQLVKRFTRSAYRGSGNQSWIWYRKHIFSGRSFNRVTAEAAKRCKLKRGELWRPGRSSHVRCWKRLSPELREKQILEASSAPGISRHHWGTDFDFFGLNPRDFKRSKRYHDEYRWLERHGLSHGFFQTYVGQRPGQVGYMEERWHWSYYPIAQAIYDFAAAHDDTLDRALNDQWDAIEAIWHRKHKNKRAYFVYVRARWRDFVFNVAPVNLGSLERASR